MHLHMLVSLIRGTILIAHLNTTWILRTINSDNDNDNNKYMYIRLLC